MHLTSEVKGILLFLLLLIVIFCSFLVYIIIDEHRCELLCEETQQNYEYSAPFINRRPVGHLRIVSVERKNCHCYSGPRIKVR
jgi:hypothetical protein